jgi:SAM-dependent methyltransferase
VDELRDHGAKRLGDVSGAVDFHRRFATLCDVAENVAFEMLETLPDAVNPLIVEVGCGTGETSLAIANGRTDARVLGLDISPANIAAAEAARAASRVADRVSFVATDFMTWPCQQADLVFSQSVLHLINGDTVKLVEKLANAVRPGGLLVFTMPRACVRNDLLFLLRRIWSLIPKGLADWTALRLASWIYPKLSVDMIADRLSYLRFIPQRLDGPTFRELLRGHGLSLVRQKILRVTTIMQPSHSFLVWRRDRPS